MAQSANGLAPETRVRDGALAAVDVPAMTITIVLTLNSRALRPRIDIRRSPFRRCSLYRGYICCCAVASSDPAPLFAAHVYGRQVLDLQELEQLRGVVEVLESSHSVMTRSWSPRPEGRRHLAEFGQHVVFRNRVVARGPRTWPTRS